MESELTFSAQFNTHSNVELIFLLEEFHLQIQVFFLSIIFSSNSKKFHLSLPAIMTNIFRKFHNCFYVGFFILFYINYVTKFHSIACFFIVRQGCGGPFGNLFWPHFE